MEVPKESQAGESYVKSGLKEPVVPTIARVIGRIRGPESGPALLCVAALHGNEPSGVLGMRRVVDALQRDRTGLVGQFGGFVGNRQALAKRARYVEVDMNRAWVPERLERARRGSWPDGRSLEAEDREMRELDQELQQFLSEVDGHIALLDLHSTSGPGPAFAVLDDSLENRSFAEAFPVPMVLGLEEEIEGTLFNHLGGQGVTCLSFEAGQHDDPASADRAEAAIWIALEASGVIERGSRPEVERGRKLLSQWDAPRLVEVRYRHEVEPDVGYKTHDGYAHFERIAKGQPLATERDSVVRTPMSGLILMPLYQAQGNDGFFVVRKVPALWFRASLVARRWHLERFVHWLPGVAHHPDLEEAFVVDRGIARWFALELFHLLGYRRQGALSNRVLVLSRRD